MTEVVSSNLPVLWWLGWFVAASVVYGLLGAWFWRALSRGKVAAEHDEAGHTKR